MQIRSLLIRCFEVLLFIACVGCASTSNSEPRMRLGSIPFPGVFTLYTTADPQNLGQHRYEAWWDKLGGPSETSRGILYTCHAGFLDLSHIRDSLDWAKYIHDRALESFAKLGNSPTSSASFQFTSSDAGYEVELREPDWWRTIDSAEREQITREAAIRIGQRVSVVVATWHEIGTWYGQETIPGISEKNSAFTWDDGTSHVIASIIAGRALRASEPWDLAVTRELNSELAELGAVDSACESRAIELVKDRWWKDGLAVRRDLDTGLGAPTKRPWLVDGLACCEGTPAVLRVADLNAVAGRDLSGLIQIKITPSRSIARKALGCERDCPPCVRGEAQVLAAIERIREEMRGKFGPDADVP